MAGSVNKAIIVGRIGRDPEIRTTKDGKKIANLSVAATESWTDRASGERKERVEWIRVVVFNDRVADFAEKYLVKGKMIYVEGSIRTRKWTNQQGQDQYTTEVCIENFNGAITDLSTRAEGEAIQNRQGGGQQASGGGYQQRERGPSQPRTGQNGAADPRYGGPRGNGYQPSNPGGPSWDLPSGGDLDDEIPF